MSLSYWFLSNYAGGMPTSLGSGGLWLKMSCPAQDGGLSKSIKYYILCLACARSGGDALKTHLPWQSNECGSNFLLIRFTHKTKTKKTRVALANPQWKICRKWIENRTSPYLICLSEVHVFFFLVSWIHRSWWLFSLLSVRWLLISEDAVHSLLTHVSSWCFAFIPQRTKY